MSKNLSLKNIKQKAYVSYHQDGLIDIVLGLCFLWFGIMAILGSESSVLGFLPALFLAPLKNKFTVPRLGFVQFSSPMDKVSKKNQIIILSAIAVIALGFGLAAGYLVSHNNNLNSFYEQNSSLITGVIASVIFLILGFVIKLNRMFLYSVLTIVIIAAGHFMNIHPGIYINIISAVFLITGLWKLNQFVKKYPLTDAEGLEDHE